MKGEACLEIAWHGKQEYPGKIIKIYHDCEGGIEKSGRSINSWHLEAYRVMTNGDHEGQIFLPHPHTNNGFFFLPTTKSRILYLKNMKRVPENPEFAEMKHGDVTFTLQ